MTLSKPKIFMREGRGGNEIISKKIKERSPEFLRAEKEKIKKPLNEPTRKEKAEDEKKKEVEKKAKLAKEEKTKSKESAKVEADKKNETSKKEEKEKSK